MGFQVVASLNEGSTAIGFSRPLFVLGKPPLLTPPTALHPSGGQTPAAAAAAMPPPSSTSSGSQRQQQQQQHRQQHRQQQPDGGGAGAGAGAAKQQGSSRKRSAKQRALEDAGAGTVAGAGPLPSPLGFSRQGGSQQQQQQQHQQQQQQGQEVQPAEGGPKKKRRKEKERRRAAAGECSPHGHHALPHGYHILPHGLPCPPHLPGNLCVGVLCSRAEGEGLRQGTCPWPRCMRNDESKCCVLRHASWWDYPVCLLLITLLFRAGAAKPMHTASTRAAKVTSTQPVGQ